MNCNKCGGSTTQSPRNPAAFECNQDNGACQVTKNGRNYPTTTWSNAGNGARRAPAPAPQRAANGNGGDTGQAWGNAKNAAAQLMSGACREGVIPEHFEKFLALARQIYTAQPTAPKPKPAPVAQRKEEPEEEEVF